MAEPVVYALYDIFGSLNISILALDVVVEPNYILLACIGR